MINKINKLEVGSLICTNYSGKPKSTIWIITKVYPEGLYDLETINKSSILRGFPVQIESHTVISKSKLAKLLYLKE